MKNSRFLALAAAAGLLLIGGCGGRQGDYVIGATLPLTGDAAQWGIPPSRGAELAVKQINEAGGVHGRKLKLVTEDTRCHPKDGVSAYRKLTQSVHPAAIVGGVCSSVTLAIAPLAERDGVVLVSPASTNPKISQAGRFIFRVIPSDDLRGQAFARYLHDQVGLKKVAILYVNNEGGVGNKESFSRTFTSLGGKVVAAEGYAQEATDLRAQLTKIKGLDCQAVVVVSYPKDTVLVMKQSREIGLGLPLYFQTEAVEDPSVLRDAGKAAEGAVYILPAQASGDAVKRFKEAYKKAYGKDPELFAAEAYDAVQLIAAAFRSLPAKEKVTGDAVRRYLEGVKKYQGASGVITFDKNGDVVKPMAIKKIQNGKPVLVTTIGG